MPLACDKAKGDPETRINGHVGRRGHDGLAQTNSPKRRRRSNVTGAATPSATGTGLTVADTAKLARAIYADIRGGMKHRQALRPYICPFHVLVDYVPVHAGILDVGCGGGLFIALLARLGRIDSAVGFDADRIAINAAQRIATTLPGGAGIRFEHRDAHEAWPTGSFDVVSLIDVMHHVQPDKQGALIATAAAHVKQGGMLLYKDMGRRPLWRAWANRLHDLLMVKEWIHYARLEDVVHWARAAGLALERQGSMDMLWYRHEWAVFRRPGVAPKQG